MRNAFLIRPHAVFESAAVEDLPLDPVLVRRVAHSQRLSALGPRQVREVTPDLVLDPERLARAVRASLVGGCLLWVVAIDDAETLDALHVAPRKLTLAPHRLATVVDEYRAVALGIARIEELSLPLLFLPGPLQGLFFPLLLQCKRKHGVGNALPVKGHSHRKLRVRLKGAGKGKGCFVGLRSANGDVVGISGAR